MSDVKTTYKHDPIEDKLYIGREQDVEPFLEANKRSYNSSGKQFKSESFNHVARIPVIVLEKWCRDHGIKYEEIMNNDKLLKQFLNDPENKFLRTKPGRI